MHAQQVGMGRLAGQRALVTGGASGIGQAVARRFAEEGAQVVVGDLAGGDVVLDVRSRESTEAAVQAAAERMGGLTTVVCNAGRPVLGTLDTVELDEWDDGLATNLTGVYLTVKAAWPYLVEYGGAILSTASILGVMATGGQAVYCAAKAGVVMLTKCLAIDGAPHGIRANCVCPGMVQTPMLDGIFNHQPDPAATRASATTFAPAGRLGEPRDIADAFVYLASDEASFVTGVALPVDGGLGAGKELNL
ncbi:MAG: SDR family NAD(P)-dependent oxidoreductase [Actinomycetia bacterium]|nr:SDR family NAD(P)-dependent oxidoreductase [Actinomycetes bacterium]